MSRALYGTALCLALSACAAPEPITSCEPIGDAEPLCGWQNPEDMAALPDDRFVVVSEYGGLDGGPGALALLDRETRDRRVLYDGYGAEGDERWGDADCPGPVGGAFSPHGVHLSERADGRLQLLAVQHGERESVEMFEVIEGEFGISLLWQGCAVAPDDSELNDVVASPDGGFFVTHLMKERGAVGQTIAFLRARKGKDTGYVLAWRPGEGFSVQPGSEGPMPNGIEIAPGGGSLFVNYSLPGEVREIDIETGETLSAAEIPTIDNATWAPDGRLLVASGLTSPAEAMRCTDPEAGVCPGEFAIVALDTETLETEELYFGGPGTPSGAGTVGLQTRDGALLIGTFAGDRVVVVSPATSR